MKKKRKISHEERDQLFHQQTAADYDQNIVKKLVAYHDVFFNPWLRKLSGGRILDYGSGTGCLIGRILPFVSKYVGIDHSKEMIEIAQKKVNSKKVKFVLGNCLKLPFENESFDAIICQGIFHHLSDVEKGLKEVLRVSKAGADIFISEPIYPNKTLLKFKNFFRNEKQNASVEKPLDFESLQKLLKTNKITYKYFYSVWVPVPKFLQRIIIKIWSVTRFKGDMVFVYCKK